MIQRRKNQKRDIVLLVATAEESGKLVSGLSQADPKFSESASSVRFEYLDEYRDVSDVRDTRPAVSGGYATPTSPGDVAPGAISLRGENGPLLVDRVLLVRRDLPVEEVLKTCVSEVGKGSVVLAASPSVQIIKKQDGALSLNGLPLVRFCPTNLRGWRLSVKRVIDVVGAALGAILLMPVFLVTAVMIKLTSPGPVFFTQARVGKDGREFTFYKFRSMVSGDDSTYREYVKAFVEDGREASVDRKGRKIYKLVDDPRITSFGRFLRKTSLDEFPQIINVLKGEMSLVGPRPCLTYEWELYENWEKARLSVTPGLTGLWQVTGRSNVAFHDMVILDLYYISNWSFWWDLKLIFRTFPVILLGRGAH